MRRRTPLASSAPTAALRSAGAAWLSIALALAGCGGGGGGTADQFATNTGTANAAKPPAGSGSGGNPPPPAPPPAEGPDTIGQWSGLVNWPQVGVHLQLLPNGNVLSWAYRYDDHDDTNTSKQVFEVAIPAGGVPAVVRRVDNSTTNIACSGFTLLPDGRMFVAGGENAGGGQIAANIFDYRSGTWTRVGDMNQRRWYPTTTTLANGDVLTVAGLIDFATESIAPISQVWSPLTGWRDLTTAIADDLGTYPRMHLAPNGQVFKAGMAARTPYLDTRGTGAWTDVAWLNHREGRDYGTSVMYGNGRVIAIGGGDPPTNTAEVINLNDANPAWRWTNPMRFARRHLNATLLADGKILVNGGTSSGGFNDATRAALRSEMWDPQTEQWSTVASMAVPRVYHSSALLLPDGRVLASGGGDPAPVNGDTNVNAEIYSPPYLFKGDRPTISSAPAVVAYGAGFAVGTPNASDITRATFIRLGSVTHAFDNSQRISELTVSRRSGVVDLVAPSDPNLAPPGHYMLFLINSNGVPSVARIIQIL